MNNVEYLRIEHFGPIQFVELEDIQLYYNGKVAPSKFTVPKGQIFKVYGYLTPSNATSNVIEFSKRVGDQFYGKGVVGNCFSIMAENGSTYLYLYGVKYNGYQIRKNSSNIVQSNLYIKHHEQKLLLLLQMELSVNLQQLLRNLHRFG